MCPVTAEIRNYGRLNEMIHFSKSTAGVKSSFMVKTEYPQFPPCTRPLQSPPSDLCSVDGVPAHCGLSRRGFVLIEPKFTADVLSPHVLSLLVHLPQEVSVPLLSARQWRLIEVLALKTAQKITGRKAASFSGTE